MVSELQRKIKSGRSDSILASMFRNILYDIGVNTSRFNVLIEKYLQRSKKITNTRESSSVRGNLKKDLLKDSMSWKVFIKGLVFLNIRKFTLTITLHHANGKITEHSEDIILDGEPDEE